MNFNDKDKIKGLIATVVFHAVLIIALVFACLYYSYPPKDKDAAELKKEEILFGGEYVMLGDFLQATDASGSPAVGETGDVSTQMVTQSAESPMKVTEKQEKLEPTAEEIAAEKERSRKKKKIGETVGGSFGKTKGDDSGSSGVSTSSATARTASGAPGVSGLEGYTLASWAEPKSSLTGVVKIKVRVNSRGKVTRARYDSGSGSAAGSLEVRKNCVQAALDCQFSVPENTTTEGVGIIIYNLTPQSN